MNLFKITYFRDNEVDNVKTAIVTEAQVIDIKNLLPWVHIIEVCLAPQNSKRDYILK